MENFGSNEETVNKWNSGETVYSVSLGGLGPDYEQAIQNLLFEIFSRWDTNKQHIDEEGEFATDDFMDHCETVVADLDKDIGFSGAQVGSAKKTAFQFVTYGYDHMMQKLDKDRIIQVKKPKELMH